MPTHRLRAARRLALGVAGGAAGGWVWGLLQKQAPGGSAVTASPAEPTPGAVVPAPDVRPGAPPSGDLAPTLADVAAAPSAPPPADDDPTPSVTLADTSIDTDADSSQLDEPAVADPTEVVRAARQRARGRIAAAVEGVEAASEGGVPAGAAPAPADQPPAVPATEPDQPDSALP